MVATVNRILGANGEPYQNGNGHAANGAARINGNHQRAIKARYDAAQITHETRRQWAESDSLSAKAANSIEVRHRLRTRARYEVANNSYARGIVETLANDTVGTGPRLQMLTEDNELNRKIEEGFHEWAYEICLSEKLRTMCKARVQDGEAFLKLVTNPKLECPVKLDLRPIEADQVATPMYAPFDPQAVDGIRFDRYSNPVEYHVLFYHPGDLVHLAPYGAFEQVPAEYMIHWFRIDRAGQSRGVPEITPAIPLFAQLRRYTLAVIAAAEIAADFAAVLYSELPPDSEDRTECEPFEALDIERRMMTTLPSGWKMQQFRPEQPATAYREFKAEILDEIIRCICMPHNIGLGNSSGYNYSSGRLDHQTYFKMLKVICSHLERIGLYRILRAWLAEGSYVTDYVPKFKNGYHIPHRWLWPGMSHVDPQKEADAQQTLLRNGMTTFSEECHKQGVDPDARAEMIAADLERFQKLGIPAPWNVVPPPPPPPAAPAPQSPPGQAPSEDDQSNDGDETEGD